MVCCCQSPPCSIIDLLSNRNRLFVQPFISLRTEMDFLFWLTSSKSDCIYYFPNDLEPNGIPLGYTSFGKWYIQSDFGLFWQEISKIFLCGCRQNVKPRTQHYECRLSISTPTPLPPPVKHSSVCCRRLSLQDTQQPSVNMIRQDTCQVNSFRSETLLTGPIGANTFAIRNKRV